MSTTARRLIAVDAENLLGCEPELASAVCWEFAIAGLLHAVKFRKGTDHLVIGVGPDWAFTVATLAPSARLLVRNGADGADLALCDALADTSFIAGRYSEVVIASVDHIFCESVRALAAAGVPTTVAGLPTTTSSELTATATSVMWLDRPGMVLGEAATVAVAPDEVELFAHDLAPVYPSPMSLLQHASLKHADLALAA